MDVFDFRQKLISEYESFTLRIRTDDIQDYVNRAYLQDEFWPSALVQLNPAFIRDGEIVGVGAGRRLHPGCERIFRSRRYRDAKLVFQASDRVAADGTFASFGSPPRAVS